MQQQANMMMYPPQGQPQGGNEQAPPQQQNPEGQQQAYAQQGYPPGMFAQMPFLGQGQAAAAHAAAAMAEQRLNVSGGAQAGYPPQGMDYSGMMAAQYPQQQQGGDPNAQPPQDYMNANNLLLARLQQGGQNPWMQMGYGMAPQGMEGYADPGMLGPWSATSAGLLGKIGGPEPKKKNVRKKHKDKPKRPLSAYNLFFRDERKKILESIPAKNEDGEEVDAKVDDDEEEELDADGKKRKKAPHGKIGFENLAKIIGQRWQKLEPDKIEHYKKLAAKDMKRYKEQMEVFLTKIENEKKKKLDDDDAAAENSEEGKAEEGDDSGEPAAKKAKVEDEEGAKEEV